MQEMPGGDHPHHLHIHHEEEELPHLSHAGEALEKLVEVVDKTSAEAEKSKKNLIRSLKIDAYAIPLITVIGVALSIGASTYWNSKQQHITQMYSQAAEIKEEMDNLFISRNSLMDAMVQLRSVREVGQLNCKNGEYVGEDKLSFTEKHYSAIFKFVNALYNSTGIFNDSIMNKVKEFSDQVDIDNKGLCATGSAKDNDLRVLQRTINTLILQQITNRRIEREKILKQLHK